MSISIIIISLGIFSLAIAAYYTFKVVSIPIGQNLMKQAKKNAKQLEQIKTTHQAISEGASAYLLQQSKVLFVFIIIFALFIILVIDDKHTSNIREGYYTAISFVFGAFISIISGFIGMKIATAGNVRTTDSAMASIQKAFQVSLQSGAVMGFGLVGLTVIGLISIYWFIGVILPKGVEENLIMETIAGFGLGGSSIALFARVGGGIFTKAADVGADLVGKVEKGIPEDDPRNPAVIADNVGDNVGDIAGMGADLFGSCAESTCAALVIGATISAFLDSTTALLYPILITAMGIPIALLVMLLTKAKDEKSVPIALKKMLILATILMMISGYFLTKWALPSESFIISDAITTNALSIYICLFTGLLTGLLIGLITEYYTAGSFKPVKQIVKASETGPATNIIFGIALGYTSAVLPIILITFSIVICINLVGMYGLAICALGMLGSLVTCLTIDAYGPVADNAGGIAEMSHMDKKVRSRTDVLDSAGNTTAAIGKGFAISSAIITSIALFAAFITRAGISEVNILNPLVLSGLFIGGILPFIFSSMTMISVGKTAHKMIEEVRRQFKEKPGILKGKDKPDYKKCIMISTQAALKEMLLPGLLVICTPLLIGFFLGIETLAGVLTGAFICGGILAIAKSNSGGAWDNAKKVIEARPKNGKGSNSHMAAIIGDTVGDPFKDTSGPSLNILLKLMAILSLVFVPLFMEYGGILFKLF